MKKTLKNITTFTLVGAAMLATACATVEGAGKDIETAGEKIQEASEKNN